MSVVSGLFTFPIGNILHCYGQYNYQIPVVNDASGYTVTKSNPSYERAVNSLPGSHLKSVIKPFLDENEIREDIRIVEARNPNICAAAGTNFSAKGDAMILMAPNFHHADPNAWGWVAKHEICHIKSNDLFTFSLVPAISQLGACLYGMNSLSFLPALALAQGVNFISSSLFTQWRESKADDFAIAKSSPEELLGGRRFLIALKEFNAESRITFYNKIMMTPSGEMRFDAFHPSTTSRIEKIEEALEERGIEIDELEERHIIEFRLKPLFRSLV